MSSPQRAGKEGLLVLKPWEHPKTWKEYILGVSQEAWPDCSKALDCVPIYDGEKGNPK